MTLLKLETGLASYVSTAVVHGKTIIFRMMENHYEPSLYRHSPERQMVKLILKYQKTMDLRAKSYYTQLRIHSWDFIDR